VEVFYSVKPGGRSCKIALMHLSHILKDYVPRLVVFNILNFGIKKEAMGVKKAVFWSDSHYFSIK
jgi:hypothetical protein